MFRLLSSIQLNSVENCFFSIRKSENCAYHYDRISDQISTRYFWMCTLWYIDTYESTYAPILVAQFFFYRIKSQNPWIESICIKRKISKIWHVFPITNMSLKFNFPSFVSRSWYWYWAVLQFVGYHTLSSLVRKYSILLQTVHQSIIRLHFRWRWQIRAWIQLFMRGKIEHFDGLLYICCDAELPIHMLWLTMKMPGKIWSENHLH